MALGLQDLMNAAQRAGVSGMGPQTGGGNVAPVSPMSPAPVAAPVDPQTQLMQLLSQSAASPQGGQTLAAIQSLMAGAGGNGGGDGQLDRMATAQAGGPRMPQMQGGGMPQNRSADIEGMGPATDGDLTEMLDASDAVRTDLPPAKRDGYTAKDSQESLEDDPEKYDDAGRKTMPWQRGRLQNDSYNGPGGAQKPMSTEEELADVQRKMGGEDGPKDLVPPAMAKVMRRDGYDPTIADHVKEYNEGVLGNEEGYYGEYEPKAKSDQYEGDHEYR